MDFIKNITASLSKAAEATTKKASELTDTAKLKVKRSRIIAGINETYTEIGKLIYTQYKDSGDESAAIAEFCLAIDDANKELAQVDAEIEAIKAAAEEAKAQARAEREAAKAAAEAAEAECECTEECECKAEEPAEASVRVCTACGAALTADALFCSKCGQKQE